MMFKKTLICLAVFNLFTVVFLTGYNVQAAEIVSSQPPITEHIRVLAASCAACHGTNGSAVSTSNTTSLPVLAGMDGQYFVAQMLAFKNGDRPATVMHHHAKGLNVDEINLLANYFSKQKPVTSVSPKPQQLKADHE